MPNSRAPAVLLCVAASVIAAAAVAGLVALGVCAPFLRPQQGAAPAPAADGPHAAFASGRAKAVAAGSDVAGEALAGADGVRLYVVDVPPDFVVVTLTAAGADHDIALDAAFGAQDDVAAVWEDAVEDDGGGARLEFSRAQHGAAVPGPLLVRVAAQCTLRSDCAGHAFTLRAEVARLGPPRELAVGEVVSGVTDPAAGHRADFTLRAPPGCDTLRIDVLDADADVDLLASCDGPAFDGAAASWSTVRDLALETLVLDADEDPPFDAEELVHLAVADASGYDHPVSFRLLATPRAEPPAEALAFPALHVPTEPRALALASVVEVLVPSGSGSGTIVSSRGLVLTARHVVEGLADGEPVTIALTLDPTRIARELFHARVVESDAGLDLALLEITGGIHDQPLPPRYRLPVCPVSFGPPPTLGEPLVTIGFPEPAGTGARSPVLYSVGVVAGFERDTSGLRIKTDAFVASGSSGGAGLDAEMRLAAVPVYTVTESKGTGQMGFLVPLGELPPSWRARILE